jgi:hypothetical protein
MKAKLFFLISLMFLISGVVYGQNNSKDTTDKEKETIDWRKVKIVKKESNVLGMKKIKKIEATAKGSNQGYQTPKSLERNARIILRKKAAKLNANFILLTNKSVAVAFGEIPSATLYGVAYTDKEKPEKGEQIEDEED